MATSITLTSINNIILLYLKIKKNLKGSAEIKLRRGPKNYEIKKKENHG